MHVSHKIKNDSGALDELAKNHRLTSECNQVILEKEEKEIRNWKDLFLACDALKTKPLEAGAILVLCAVVVLPL